MLAVNKYEQAYIDEERRRAPPVRNRTTTIRGARNPK